MKKRGDATRPPYPKTVRWWPKLRAYIAGRRDARAQLQPDSEQHVPYTRSLAAVSHRGWTDVGHWLFKRIEPIDHGTATSAEAVSDTRRILPRIEEQLAEVEGALGTADPVRRATLEREKGRLRSQKQHELDRASTSAAQLARLVSERRTSEALARAAAAAWETRYRTLRDSFARGFARKSGAAVGPVPAIPPFLPWTVGDLPLTFPVIETEAGDVVRLATSAPAEGAIPA